MSGIEDRIPPVYEDVLPLYEEDVSTRVYDNAPMRLGQQTNPSLLLRSFAPLAGIALTLSSLLAAGLEYSRPASFQGTDARLSAVTGEESGWVPRVIEEGETYWSVAVDFYRSLGSPDVNFGKIWLNFQLVNGLSDPYGFPGTRSASLRPGDVVFVPPSLDAALASYSRK